nr:hypothetical protein [Candidatus Gracilibacteria bacterium]
MINTIKKSILAGVTFFLTVVFLYIGYAALTNTWTDPASLEVTTSSTLTADSWNKLLQNFNSLSGSVSVLSTSAYGIWSQTSERTGTGKFIWDAQVQNTNSSIFSWTASQNYITVNQSGYYELYSDVLGSGLADGQRQDAHILVNSTSVAFSLGMGGTSQIYFNHHLHYIGYINAGSQVQVDIMNAGNRFGWAVPGNRSTLTIKKL